MKTDIMASSKSFLHKGFELLERGLNRVLGQDNNPMFYLGALGFYFLWVVFITGIYVYIFFDTSITGAYSSVERLTHEQKYFGGIMRSFHRYASDGMMLVMVLHIVREWAMGRMRLARWFTWVTGLPIFWLVVISGITGYWLVWDQMAQYIAVVTAEWLDALPLAGSAIARNFLTNEALSSRFFTLLMFVHIFAPIFMLLVLWIHLQRVNKPRLNPPVVMTTGVSLAMLVLSLYKPALSHPAANLDNIPPTLNLDWFYVGLYPLFDGLHGGAIWAFAGLGTLLLALAPFIPRSKKKKPAEVFLDQCNGCRRCQVDCPYNAITMVQRSDGKPFAEEAQVDADLCVNCGICVGACPSSTPFRRSDGLITGIDLPEFPLADLRDLTNAAADGLKGNNRTIVFACKRDSTKPDPDKPVVPLPCIGMLPPSFIDYVLSRDLVDKVELRGCGNGDCYDRLGTDWMDDRIDRKRDPFLRARVPRGKIIRNWKGGNSYE